MVLASEFQVNDRGRGEKGGESRWKKQGAGTLVRGSPEKRFHRPGGDTSEVKNVHIV